MSEPLERMVALEYPNHVWDRIMAEARLGRKVVEEREALRDLKGHVWWRLSPDEKGIHHVTSYSMRALQQVAERLEPLLCDADRLASGGTEEDSGDDLPSGP